MEHKAAKKAKKGIFNLVFGRTALVAVLLLLQVGMLFGVATILKEYAIYVFGVITLIQIVVVITIMNDGGAPEFSRTWIFLILMFPLFGCVFYIYTKLDIGNRYIHDRFRKMQLETVDYMKQDRQIIEALRVSKPANANLAHYMQQVLGFPTYRNTRVEYFGSGQDKFEELMRQLNKAEKFIFLEYFIISEGYMWDTILQTLIKKASEGVEVRIMYDGMCSISMLPYSYPKKIQQYGIKCKMFSPIHPVLSTTQNNRDHRKIFVIDGKVGFTGGVNLADEYINRKKRFGYWKDTAIMLEGDAVQSLTILFLQMWNITETKKEDYQRYLTTKTGGLRRELGFILPYGDSPYDCENVGKETYLHILNHAKKYVHIMTPYLIPDSELCDALCRAAKSGIDVKIIMPAIPDKWYAFAVAKTYYPDLIRAGVKIYEFTPGFVHAKVFVSDDDTATVGTVNLDYRSLYLHFECGVFIYNNMVVRDVELDYEETLKQCHRVSMVDVKNISIFMKICGKVLRLIAPLM